MADLFWLTLAQLMRIAPFFPLPHGVPRVDDRRVISGILHVFRNGLRWRDAPEPTARTRRSTTASYAGAGSACSTLSSQAWSRRPASLTG